MKVSRFSSPDSAPLSLREEDPQRREWIDHTVDAVIHPAKHAWEQNMYHRCIAVVFLTFIFQVCFLASPSSFRQGVTSIVIREYPWSTLRPTYYSHGGFGSPPPPDFDRVSSRQISNFGMGQLNVRGAEAKILLLTMFISGYTAHSNPPILRTHLG